MIGSIEVAGVTTAAAWAGVELDTLLEGGVGLLDAVTSVPAEVSVFGTKFVCPNKPAAASNSGSISQ